MVENLARLPLLNEMRLRCGDVQFELSILDTSDIYFIEDKMVAYRRSATSVTGNPRTNFLVGRDGILVRYAYACLKDLQKDKEHILKWYCRYMAESGFQFLPFAKWLGWFLKNDRKFCVLKVLVMRGIKQTVKRYMRGFKI